MRTLIVIPAYNEEESIVSTISELNTLAPQFDYIIVNDGSTDSTRMLCRKNHYNLLDLPANVGLTYGFQAGIKYAIKNGYDSVIQFDADGQHEAQYIEPMVEQLKASNADIVIGSRFVTGKKTLSLRMIGSRLISLFILLTTGKWINDPTSGMRLYNRRTLEVFASKNDFGPEPDSLAYLIRKGATVSEIQVEMRDRTAGTSYLNLASSIEYMLRACISILVVQWFR